LKHWFSKNLGDAMMAYAKIEELKKLIFTICGKISLTNDMAVFIRHESEGHLHCEVKVYFSPKFAIFANKLKIIPCEKPSEFSLGLLIGNEKAKNILFAKA